MKKQNVTSENYTMLLLFIPCVLGISLRMDGLLMWLLAAFELLVLLFVYHCFLAPAGIFVKYRLEDEKISITNVIRKQTKVYSLQNDVHLYIYTAFISHLIISSKPIATKREAKKLIRSGEAGCVTLWGQMRDALAPYEKKATKLPKKASGEGK